MSGREDRVLAELLRLGPSAPTGEAARHQNASFADAVERFARRPPIAQFVEAVEQAAQTIATSKAHIRELQDYVDDLEGQNRNLHDQLESLHQSLQATEASLRAESDRAALAENLAAQQTRRTADLEEDLAKVHDLLGQVTDTIAGSFGVPSTPRLTETSGPSLMLTRVAARR